MHRLFCLHDWQKQGKIFNIARFVHIILAHMDAIHHIQEHTILFWII